MATLKVVKKGPKLFAFVVYRPSGTNTTLSFSSKGVATLQVAAKGDYLVAWVVRGLKGTEYSYVVTLDGKEVEGQPEGAISEAKFEGGYIPFSLGEAE